MNREQPRTRSERKSAQPFKGCADCFLLPRPSLRRKQLRGLLCGHGVDGLQNSGDDLVRIGLGVRTAIFKIALVARS